MAWHEILATGIILAGTAFYCWAAYSRKSGPTSCIGVSAKVMHRLWQVRGGRRLHSDRKEGPGDFRRQGKKPVIFPLTTGQKRL